MSSSSAISGASSPGPAIAGPARRPSAACGRRSPVAGRVLRPAGRHAAVGPSSTHRSRCPRRRAQLLTWLAHAAGGLDLRRPDLRAVLGASTRRGGPVGDRRRRPVADPIVVVPGRTDGGRSPSSIRAADGASRWPLAAVVPIDAARRCPRGRCRGPVATLVRSPYRRGRSPAGRAAVRSSRARRRDGRWFGRTLRSVGWALPAAVADDRVHSPNARRAAVAAADGCELHVPAVRRPASAAGRQSGGSRIDARTRRASESRAT